MMSFKDLDPRVSIQVFKHVTFDVGSLTPTEGSNFLLDAENKVLALKRESQPHQEETRYQHVGFVALKRDEFDEMPSQITVGGPMSDEHSEPSAGLVVPAPFTVFNCQEAFYSLSNLKSYRFGLYAFNLQERSQHPHIGQMSRLVWRLALSMARPESFEVDTGPRNKKLSKQAEKELALEMWARDPIAPTLAVKRVLLQQGSLRRLGRVADIRHNSGKHQR